MPNRAHSRRDPQKGKNGFSTSKGFSLIELMIVIGVIAIISSLALPSYRTIIEKRQVTSGAQQVGAFISAAQLEAVKRNENVLVSFDFTDQANWCMGMGIIVPGEDECDCSTAPARCTFDFDGTTRLLTPDNLNYSEAVVAMNGDGAFIIDPVRGMLTDFTDVMSLELLSQPENTYALNVDISPTGRVRICSNMDRADIEVPGFESCQ